MYSFNAQRNARFACVADFATGAYLNLHFLDATRSVILFHLSLRRDEGVIVVNRREKTGWRREVTKSHPFEKRPVAVDLRFDARGVTVRVDGRRAGRFDALPRPDRAGRYLLRGGFPGLGAIACVAVEGACQGDSIQIETAQWQPQIAPARGLYLTDRLDLAFAGLTQAETDAIRQAKGPARVVVTGEDDGFPAILQRDGGAGAGFAAGRQLRAQPSLTAVLPGWVWDDHEGDLPLALVMPDGAGLGAMTLTRETLAARIGGLADGGALMHGDRVALTAIEHARHGHLLPLLSVTQRASLIDAAERFDLTGYLVGPSDLAAMDAVPLPPPSAPVPPTDSADLVMALRKRFVTLDAQHDTQPADDPVALLDRLQREAGLPPSALHDLLLSMTEWFCLNGQGTALARYRRSVLPGPPDQNVASDNAWALSATIPFLYAEGAFDTLAKTLWRLSTLDQGWVLTPNLGWVAEQLACSAPDLDGHPVPPEQRNAILWSLLDWIDGRAADYWGRTDCVALIQGIAALLARADTLPTDLRDRLIWLSIRAHGLTPPFWAALDAAALQGIDQYPMPIRRARAAFDALMQAVDAPEGTPTDPADCPDRAVRIDHALDLFRQFGTHAMGRFRRALLGPAGVPLGTEALPDPIACLMAGLTPSEAVLRHLAFPRRQPGAAQIPTATASLVQEGIALAYGTVPRGPLLSVQMDTARDLDDLLAADGCDTERLLQRLSALNGAAGGFLGIALALSAVRGLIAKGREDEAAQIAAHAMAMVPQDADAEAQNALASAPAPALALAALRTQYADHPLTGRVSAVLAGRVAPSPGAPAADQDRASDLRRLANPVHDTLVCVYTCQANLATRVAVIRDGWMRELEDLGIPVLIFVGDRDADGAADGTDLGRRDGDVVYLDALDDYESLPQKSLAMVRWVLTHTGFSHILKIDDDCFLDARAYFDSLTHLKFDYYGRPLRRGRGQMDRTWHMAKSRSVRGRLELDKSPEPSTYADGGSGYALSRIAMAALIDAADSADGQALIAQSFMEDKLVGDLLASRGVFVNGEDYRISVLRRTNADGPLVPQWENGFLPFAGSGIKLAHLDGHHLQDEALAASRKPWPSTFKIWPGYQPVRLGAQSNALDLISAPSKLAEVNAAPVAVVACLRNEAAILPRFLEHYRALGVRGFLIADNGSDDGSLEYLAEQSDVALFAVDTEYSQSHYGVAWQQALLSNLRCGRWSLVADADELLFWTRLRQGVLSDLTARLDDDGADAARVFMLDMYPGAPLALADFIEADPFEQAPFVDGRPFRTDSGARGPFSNGPMWTSALRHRLIPGSRPELFVAQKYALLKYQPWMRLTAGLHFVANARVAEQELFFGHFKYNAAFHAKAQAEVARKQHFNDAEEYRKYLALASEGRDVLFDPAVSVRWDACDFVTRRLVADTRT